MGRPSEPFHGARCGFLCDEVGGAEGQGLEVPWTRAEPRSTAQVSHLPPRSFIGLIPSEPLGLRLSRGELRGRALGTAVASTKSATLDKYHKLFHIYYGQQFD